MYRLCLSSILKVSLLVEYILDKCLCGTKCVVWVARLELCGVVGVGMVLEIEMGKGDLDLF